MWWRCCTWITCGQMCNMPGAGCRICQKQEKLVHGLPVQLVAVVNVFSCPAICCGMMLQVCSSVRTICSTPEQVCRCATIQYCIFILLESLFLAITPRGHSWYSMHMPYLCSMHMLQMMIMRCVTHAQPTMFCSMVVLPFVFHKSVWVGIHPVSMALPILVLPNIAPVQVDTSESSAFHG